MAVEERKASEGENTSQGNLGRLELFEFGLGFLRHRLWLKSESRVWTRECPTSAYSGSERRTGRREVLRGSVYCIPVCDGLCRRYMCIISRLMRRAAV